MFDVICVQMKRQLLSKSVKVADLFVLLTALAITTWLLVSPEEAFSVPWSKFLSWRLSIQNFVILASLLVLWVQCFRFFGLYADGRLATLSKDIMDIWKATTVGTIVIAAAGTVFEIEIVTPQFVGTFWIVSSLLATVVRVALRLYMAHLRLREPHFRRVLIVGTNERARQLAHDIAERPDLGYRVIGFMDIDQGGCPDGTPLPLPVVAECSKFSEFLRDHVVDEVVMCLPFASCYHQAWRTMQLCEEQGIVVRVLGSLFPAKLARMTADEFCSQAVLTFQVGGMRGGTVLLKRVVDVVVATAAVVGLLPLFLLTALAVKLDSRGPVLFVQERVGLNKRRFSLYKFRTMVTDAEQLQAQLEHLNEVKGAAFKITNDPRITRIGHFLRKTSLDELPQLINVIKGDMSLVGPRPLPPRDYREFSEDWHRRRFSVPPGITCLWQVSGRSRLSFERWMELDMEYIDRWSLRLDMHILMRTIPVVLRRDGAM